MMTGCIASFNYPMTISFLVVLLNPESVAIKQKLSWATMTIGSSNLGMPYLFCNAPSGLTVSDLTPMSANLLWDDSGADAIGYKLQIINVSSGAIYNFSLGAGMTSRHLGPAILSPGEDYAFRLKAICSDGTKTSWSSTYFFSLPMRLSEFSGNMVIFPNPGNGYFTLQISGLNTTQVQAEIFQPDRSDGIFRNVSD